MTFKNTFQTSRNIVTTAVLAFGMAACGGGGGGAPAQTAAAAAAPAPVAAAPAEDMTGVVAIVLKDAPSDDFSEILVTFTRIELLGNGAPVVIFEGEETFDLLALHFFYDMVAASDQVPIGTYDKIRLQVSNIELVPHQEPGNPLPSIFPDRPANGHIDLNPRGSFDVTPNGALLLTVDMDANKSIHIVGTGSGRYKFRPVVFVDIQQRELTDGLVRLHGFIGDIADSRFYFELCGGQAHIDTDTNGCLLVNVLPDTSIFNSEGLEIDFQQLMSGDEVTVIGRAVVVEEDDDPVSTDDGEDTIRVIQINALIIQEGPLGSAGRFVGQALTAVNVDDLFEFLLDPGQGFAAGSVVQTLVQEGTRILSTDFATIDTVAIQPGINADVVGVMRLSNADPDRLNSMLIVLHGDDDDSDVIEGAVTEIADDGTEAFYIDQEGASQCVTPTATARYFVETDQGTVEGGFELVELTLVATVFGVEDLVDGCFDADTVYLEQPVEIQPI